MSAYESRTQAPPPELTEAQAHSVALTAHELGLAEQMGPTEFNQLTESLRGYIQKKQFVYLGINAYPDDVFGTPDMAMDFTPKWIDGNGEFDEAVRPRRADPQSNFLMFQAVKGVQGLIVGVESGIIPKPDYLVGATNRSMSRLASRFGFMGVGEYLALGEKKGPVPTVSEIDDMVYDFDREDFNPLDEKVLLDVIRLHKETPQERAVEAKVENVLNHWRKQRPGSAFVAGRYEDLRDRVLSIPTGAQARLTRLAIKDVEATGFDII